MHVLLTLSLTKRRGEKGLVWKWLHLNCGGGGGGFVVEQFCWKPCYWELCVHCSKRKISFKMDVPLKMGLKKRGREKGVVWKWLNLNLGGGGGRTCRWTVLLKTFVLRTLCALFYKIKWEWGNQRKGKWNRDSAMSDGVSYCTGTDRLCGITQAIMNLRLVNEDGHCATQSHNL